MQRDLRAAARWLTPSGTRMLTPPRLKSRLFRRIAYQNYPSLSMHRRRMALKLIDYKSTDDQQPRMPTIRYRAITLGIAFRGIQPAASQLTRNRANYS